MKRFRSPGTARFSGPVTHSGATSARAHRPAEAGRAGAAPVSAIFTFTFGLFLAELVALPRLRPIALRARARRKWPSFTRCFPPEMRCALFARRSHLSKSPRHNRRAVSFLSPPSQKVGQKIGQILKDCPHPLREYPTKTCAIFIQKLLERRPQFAKLCPRVVEQFISPRAGIHK